MKAAVDRFGVVDVLVNNAGIFKPTPFLEHSADDLSRYLDIIVKGTFFASQNAIPEMQKRGAGSIVNVGSMWADHAVGATPSSAYSAAKAGVHALPGIWRSNSRLPTSASTRWRRRWWKRRSTVPSCPSSRWQRFYRPSARFIRSVEMVSPWTLAKRFSTWQAKVRGGLLESCCRSTAV